MLMRSHTRMLLGLSVMPLLLCIGEAAAQDCSFGDGTIVTDLDQDGQLTATDIGLWFKAQFANLPMEDLDGDGFLTERDLKLFLRNFAKTMAGDLDGDGTVGPVDLQMLSDRLSAQSPQLVHAPDQNGDGRVDVDDFILLADKLGCPLDDATLDRMVKGILKALLYLPNDEWGNQGFGSDDDHVTYFSDTWNHQESLSYFWPPNHEGSISSTWMDPPVHNELQSEHWPPNHIFPMSELWDSSGHTQNSSDQWPSNHHRFSSNTWPGNHMRLVSRVWPAGHTAQDSSIDGKSDHWGSISITWNGVHAQQLSNERWPPNHAYPHSGTWFNHDQQISATWPPSHFSGISTLWPSDTEGWPANHLLSTSNDWGTPPDSIPFMPPDHSIWSSVLDLVPFFGE